MSETERPWTVEEAAEWLQLDEETVRRWARAGRLPARKLGREWRFAPADVRAFVPDPVFRPDVAAIVEAQMHAAHARANLPRRRSPA